MKILCWLALVIILIMLEDGHSYTNNKSRRSCSQFDYNDYKLCQRGEERSSSCQSSCDGGGDCSSCSDCACEECYECSHNSCNSCCSSCCNTITARKTFDCCIHTCHSSCAHSSCRTKCKDQCREEVPKEVSDKKLISNNINTQNLSTVIHLNTIINNENKISTPVNISESNVNNFPPYSNTWVMPQPNVPIYPWIFPQPNVSVYPNTWAIPQPPKEAPRCCDILIPQCVPSNDTRRCFYLRRQICGPQCQSSVIHEYCKSPPCEKNTVYIPQPNPTCSWVNYWPYSNCGPPQQPNCEGCYGHYFGQQIRISCSTFCYDEGYGIGPYYRKGPYYRPCYMHAPPCYQGGICENMVGYNYQQQFCGFGGQLPGFGGQVPSFGGQVPGFGGQVPVLAGGYGYGYIAGVDIVDGMYFFT